MNDENDESTEKDDVLGIGKIESETDWDAIDGEKQGAGSRDKVKHIERNDQLFIMRMM